MSLYAGPAVSMPNCIDCSATPFEIRRDESFLASASDSGSRDPVSACIFVSLEPPRPKHRPRYTAAEAEFLPASLALIETPGSPTARITGVLLVLLVALAILWGVLAHVIDSIVGVTRFMLFLRYRSRFE